MFFCVIGCLNDEKSFLNGQKLALLTHNRSNSTLTFSIFTIFEIVKSYVEYKLASCIPYKTLTKFIRIISTLLEFSTVLRPLFLHLFLFFKL